MQIFSNSVSKAVKSVGTEAEANLLKAGLLRLGYAESITGRIHGASLQGKWYIPDFVKRYFNVNGASNMIIDVVPTIKEFPTEIGNAVKPKVWEKSILEEIETAVIGRQ